MRGREIATAVGLICLLTGAVVGFSVISSADNPRSLSVEEAKGALLELPYEFEFHDVAEPDDAFRGTATGAHDTVVPFGVSLGGDREAVVLAPHETGEEATGGATFLVTSDSFDEPHPGDYVAEPRFGTAAQWAESSRIITAIEQKLCRETTGDPCGI